MVNIIKLKINDYVEIENRVFQIVLRPQSNGSMRWLHPCLILLRPEVKRESLTKEEKELLIYQINKIKLKKEDLPINEKNIKKKNIFKINERRV